MSVCSFSAGWSARVGICATWVILWAAGCGGLVSERASFPSGHAVGAFALAAVFSARYRDHRWVPWVAYGVATLVGFSRITLQSHFPSDVFAGSVLGGVIGHAVGAGGLNQAGP